MPTLQLTQNGEVVGVVEVSGNDVQTRDFDDGDLENTFEELDGLTGYESDSPTEDGATHVDAIVPMSEPQVVGNVRMVAGVNALDVTDV